MSHLSGKFFTAPMAAPHYRPRPSPPVRLTISPHRRPSSLRRLSPVTGISSVLIPHQVTAISLLAGISHRNQPHRRFSISLPHRRLSLWLAFHHLPHSSPVSLGSRHSSSPTFNVEQLEEEESTYLVKLRELKQKIALLGINWDDSCKPGMYTHLFCPKCKGGQSMERSLSLHINLDGDFAMWRCFCDTCGWAGQAFADNRPTYNKVNQISKSKSSGQMTEESLGLEPLGHKLIAYFSGRMISVETLQRNAVRQISGDQNVMAFTYRRNGVLLGCKYRTIEKRFWQEKGTEKVLYGLDDINEAAEIIIVEGEIDKLAMEEAGFRNCVSVPGGAPQKISTKELPSLEKDTAYQYVWNCKEYFDKVSRIILATDGDIPGQALAEELARRLGRERCWRVSWPKKDEFGCFKDANEVLMNLGTVSLKKVIQNAELYEVNCSN